MENSSVMMFRGLKDLYSILKILKFSASFLPNFSTKSFIIVPL